MIERASERACVRSAGISMMTMMMMMMMISLMKPGHCPPPFAWSAVWYSVPGAPAFIIHAERDCALLFSVHACRHTKWSLEGINDKAMIEGSAVDRIEYA